MRWPYLGHPCLHMTILSSRYSFLLLECRITAATLLTFLQDL